MNQMKNSKNAIMSAFKFIKYSAVRNNSTLGFKNQKQQIDTFENVFSFPFVKNFALINRLKVYQFYGSCIAIPGSGLMEYLNYFPEQTFLSTSYIGVTGGIVLSLFTIPLKNIIGHLYISEDNKNIKISSVDYFGKRRDRIISADDWIPILDLKPNILDAIYLQPKLTDGSTYKLFVKYGIVRNSKKMAEVLE